MLTKVRGAFPEIAGTIRFAEKPEDSSVEVEIQTATLSTNSEMRDGHLRGDDFFSVEKYPTIVFKSTGGPRRPAAPTSSSTETSPSAT